MALSKLAMRRLTTLIKFMKSLPASANKHFDMGTYIRHTGTHEHFGKNLILSQKDLHTCGTSACALGWAATIPSFKKAGLCLVAGYGVDLMSKGLRLESYSEDAGCKFFDLNPYEANDLFGARTDLKTPKQWARHAEKLVKQWNAE
jgi:hypothetical protein